MKKYLALCFALIAAVAATAQQLPLYVVNGTIREEIQSIPPEDIEHVEMLPADEQTIARYGNAASCGVMLVTLRYDQPAVFEADSTFTDYIARQVKWADDDPVARVILRYTITPDGQTIIDKELESTDTRLKRRVLKAVAEAPRWTPAKKKDTPVASEGVLRIQLPAGKPMPRSMELVWR